MLKYFACCKKHHAVRDLGAGCPSCTTSLNRPPPMRPQGPLVPGEQQGAYRLFKGGLPRRQGRWK